MSNEKPERDPHADKSRVPERSRNITIYSGHSAVFASAEAMADWVRSQPDTTADPYPRLVLGGE